MRTEQFYIKQADTTETIKEAVPAKIGRGFHTSRVGRMGVKATTRRKFREVLNTQQGFVEPISKVSVPVIEAVKAVEVEKPAEIVKPVEVVVEAKVKQAKKKRTKKKTATTRKKKTTTTLSK